MKLSLHHHQSLGRYFIALTVAALVALALSIVSMYGLTWQTVRDSEREYARASAEAAVANLAQLLVLLNRSIEGQAQNARWTETIAKGDPNLIADEEERIARAMPGALRVRLLAENVDALDESRVPRMGYADLELVRQALTSQPQPVVHAANTPDVHLALARRLEKGGGVILASLSWGLLQDALAPGSACGVELRQDNLVLGYKGGESCKEGAPGGELPVAGSSWKLVYWTSYEISTYPWVRLAIFFVLAPAVAAYARRLHRRLLLVFREDQDSVALMVSDLLFAKLSRNYPVQLAEGERLVKKIAQLKRREAEDPARSASEREAAERLLAREIQASPPLPETLSSREPKPTPSVQLNKAAPAAEKKPPSVMVSPTIFRAYDIRGIVGETLTFDVVQVIARAIGSEALARGENRLAVARDGRLSSPELSQALIKGLQASGCSVTDLGLAPTPLLYFATHVLNVESGVMLTGSHNPSNYNGLKIVIGGDALSEQDLQALRLRIENGDLTSGSGRIDAYDLIPEYIEHVSADAQLGRPLKIVMDCGNGVAAKVAPELMHAMGCEVVELFCEVDGHFPNHHPDPADPENLQDLVEAVLKESADLGVAFDGDGDRLGVVDSSGKIIWPDRQMMLFAADVLSREPGADIIYDVKCTRHLASQIVRNGGRPLMWKSGHSLIKAKLKETGAMLAGEMSGHIVFQERWFGFDDAIYACARLVEILSNDPRASAEVFAELPDSVNTPELYVPVREGEQFALMEKLRSVALFPDARITDIDGLRVDFVDGWGLARASNTAPALMYRFEADNELALARIQHRFRELMLQVKPDIDLPF
jgi:phosphomannomutase/phosphoglucomutase